MESDIQELALQIDSALESGATGELDRLICACENQLENAEGLTRVILWFYIANCYSGINTSQDNVDSVWSWEKNELIFQVLSLRKAASEPSFESSDVMIRCKILTNLGNVLNQIGRPIEAIRLWDQALRYYPIFAMAIGNKGRGVTEYANYLYDQGHAAVLVAEANKTLKQLTNKRLLWDSGEDTSARAYFISVFENNNRSLEEVGYDYEFDLDRWALGKTKGERKYRQWCLDQNLFLNPLNDIITKSVAATDSLHLPSHTYGLEEHPRFPEYYNHLKQEFVTARYLYYEAGQEKNHFSNHEVFLVDSYNATRFGYRTEQLKMSFRMAYSIFDKVALFLNDYFSVGLKASSVNFRNIWGNRSKDQFVLHPCFASSVNWPLRGLYFLSKELFDPNFNDVASPDAKELAIIRNRIEHRFLCIQHYYSQHDSDMDFQYYISIDDFEIKTLRILRLAREALIYLSLAMHREEKIREFENPDSVKLPIYSFPVEERN